MTGPESIPALERGALVAEGKTKRIYEWTEPGRVLVEYKNDITRFDDPSKTKQFETKARHSNTTNARVFEMLNRAGIPTAFVRQHSETEFIAEKCTMVPLEVIARRYAMGSYLDRMPEFKTDGKIPHRFDDYIVEFFLKTTKGGLTTSEGERLVDGLDALKGEEDPLIEDPYASEWKLLHSKKAPGSAESDLSRTVAAAKVASRALMEEMADLTKRTFAVIEAFFESQGWHLVDFKIEFGMTSDGRLVVADVIDNDSWRLRDADWNELSKQSFRDHEKTGESMESIEDKYGLVAAMMERSRAA